MANHQLVLADGKICYLEIPAVDIQQAAAFYSTVFHWHVRTDNEGNASFDDAAGQVSGMWVTGRPAATQPAIMISIMVYNIEVALRLIRENNGKVLQEPAAEARQKVALFADPTGNVFSLYQHGG